MKYCCSILLSFFMTVTINGMIETGCSKTLGDMIQASDAVGVANLLNQKKIINIEHYQKLASGIIAKRQEERAKINKFQIVTGFAELTLGGLTCADLIINQPTDDAQAFTGFSKTLLGIIGIGTGIKDILFNNRGVTPLNNAYAIEKLLEDYKKSFDERKSHEAV